MIITKNYIWWRVLVKTLQFSIAMLGLRVTDALKERITLLQEIKRNQVRLSEWRLGLKHRVFKKIKSCATFSLVSSRINGWIGDNLCVCTSSQFRAANNKGSIGVPPGVKKRSHAHNSSTYSVFSPPLNPLRFSVSDRHCRDWAHWAIRNL